MATRTSIKKGIKKYAWIVYIFVTVSLLFACYFNIKDIERERENHTQDIHFTYDYVTPVADLTCLECHSDLYNETETGVSSPIWFDSHRGYDMLCSDCHIEDMNYKLGNDWDQTHKEFDVTCSFCHDDMIEMTMPGLDWFSSTHMEAGTTCADCHGGDPTNGSAAMSGNFIGIPEREDISKICGNCHFAEYEEFKTSVHNGYILDEDGNTIVANTCTDCHGIHHIEKHNNPESPVYTLNSPDTCAKCHSSKFYSFQDSYHGAYVVFGGEIVAACPDCHGVHAIKPVADPDSVVHPDNLAKTCSDNCHENDLKVDVSQGHVHYEGSLGEREEVYYIFGFNLMEMIPLVYKMAVFGMMGGLIALMFLENYGWGKIIGRTVNKWKNRKEQK